MQPASDANAPSGEFFLAIDGGGTNSSATIASSYGKTATGNAGPSNICYLEVAQCLRVIEDAVTRAIAEYASSNDLEQLRKENIDQYRSSHSEKTFMPSEWRFKKVWAGIAGVDQVHPRKKNELARRLEILFKVSLERKSLILTHDDLLLTSALHTEASLCTGLSVIAGTGTVCTAFKQQVDGEPVIIGRTGGWGPLIGDDGSAFGIGRQALRTVLSDIEGRQGEDRDVSIALMKPLEVEVLRALHCSSDEVLRTVLRGKDEKEEEEEEEEEEGGKEGKQTTKHRIATLAKCVTTLAFDVPTDKSDFRAMEILHASVASLVRDIIPLTRKKKTCDPTQSILILGGRLMSVPGYRRLLLRALTESGIPDFKRVVVVDHTSKMAAEMLVNKSAGEISETVNASDEDDSDGGIIVQTPALQDADIAEMEDEAGGYLTDE
ncbi:hypothetical protein KEM54_005150 [Ascosphaera aggregata]|nr:hypothetical protein KEM54_005150 [Ascosphaera aggregata]